jgi:chromosomal replication initiator protein
MTPKSTDKAAHDPAQQWERIQAKLLSEFGAAVYNSWLRPIRLADAQDGQVTLAVPTRFMRDWIVSHYAHRIRALWKQERAGVRTVSIQAGTAELPSDASKSDASTSDAPTSVAPKSAAMRQRATAPFAGYSEVSSPITSTSAGRAADKAGDKSADPSHPEVSARGGGQGAGNRLTGQRPGTPATTSPLALDNLERDLSAPLDPRFTFDSFIVAKSNELAHAAARRVAEADGVAFNPLFLHGGVGLGKTHLMHAIAHQINARQPERRVIYLSAEKFMYQFIRAVRFKDTMSFKQQFRSVDVLMVDDVQFIAGKDATQEEFFHTFNALCDQNRQIVISCDRSPSDLDGIEERIRSRLGWGLVANIYPTDYELRLSILQAKAERIGAKGVPQKVLEFLAHRITSNIRELEGALNRIFAYSNLVGRPITMEGTQDVLQDLLRANDRRVTIEEIQKRVAEHFSIKLSDMHSPRRARAVARPRQIAMYLAKQLTTRSLPEIGRKFGKRDHTTVMHAVRRIDELREIDAAFAEDVDLLRRMLES